jgi:acyl-CoA reductase-like NAD-dependent aldehyde dehydrogenase
MIFKFSNLDEVIEQVNNTKYGLASGIITSKMEQAFAYVNHVKAGSVW